MNARSLSALHELNNRQSGEIRIRAERKTGQLLQDSEKAQRGPGKKKASSDATSKNVQTLADIGISRDQSSKWQKLADSSDKNFESIRKRKRA